MKQIDAHIEPVRDGAFIHMLRNGKLESKLRLGPNHVHAFITKSDGYIIDLGISKNLLTNAGRDLWAACFGHQAHKTGVSTAIATATSMTDSGMGASTNQYAGWRVYQPVTGLTTAPVYGNIGSNTATVLTLDQWWTPADGVGASPASGNAYTIFPSCAPRFMGLTTDSAAASASDTILAGPEITTGGCARAKATYAHTLATATYTMQVAYNVTASFTNIHKMGLFTASTLTAGGILVFETVLNLDATVGPGDTLTVTDTITLSG